MERDNFRIIKTKQELFDVKYIRKKGLKVRIEGSTLEITLLFIKNETNNEEIYRVLLGKYKFREYSSMYEAVTNISLLIDRNIEEIEQKKLNQRKWYRKVKWYIKVKKFFTVKKILIFLSYVISFGIGAIVADLLIK